MSEVLCIPASSTIRLSRSQPAFHEVLLTESQASLRIADLTASESVGQAASRLGRPLSTAPLRTLAARHSDRSDESPQRETPENRE